jgi:hypothetical protein
MFSVNTLHGMQDSDRVAKMTERMKTVCVGRFLVDVPEAADVSFSSAAVDGFTISTRSENDQQFASRVAAREAEINQVPNKLGRKNLESSPEVKGNDFHGKIFIYGRLRTYGIEDDKRVYTEIVAVDGYVHKGMVSLDFIAKGYDPQRVGSIVKLISQLSPRGADEIPTGPGFCIDRSMIRDPLSAAQAEGVTMFAGLREHPDFAIVFSTMAGTKPGPRMLARSAAAAARQPFYVRAAFKTLREGERTINGLLGEELAVKVTEMNFATGFNFDWEMAGKENDVFAPLVTLELQTGVNPRAGGKPVQSSLAETALIELWDKISSSIRLRPSAPPKAVPLEPVAPPLGTHASAGATCPHTGWWRCNEGGNGTNVLGGQLQYLKKGQRMPQALLLPPQTMWQKVRGLQPHYESGTPTLWKLVDKRSHPRTVSPVPLAQAVSPPTANSHGAPMRIPPIGSVVKTGEPCPASGWWRCEESQALDKTRWFPYGSLLPAATFRVPPGVFGKNGRAPTAVQRRSVWQLVRYAHASEPREVANGQVSVTNPSDASSASADPVLPKSST